MNKLRNMQTNIQKYECQNINSLDSDIKTFSAKLVSSNDNQIILDRTAFYPGGGGQPCDIGELKDRPFFLFIVDELHEGVYAINISESFPDTSAFGKEDKSLRKKFSMSQAIKLRNLQFDEIRKLKKYRTIQDGNEQYYVKKELETSKEIWNINRKNKRLVS